MDRTLVQKSRSAQSSGTKSDNLEAGCVSYTLLKRSVRLASDGCWTVSVSLQLSFSEIGPITFGRTRSRKSSKGLSCSIRGRAKDTRRRLVIQRFVQRQYVRGPRW